MNTTVAVPTISTTIQVFVPLLHAIQTVEQRLDALSARIDNVDLAVEQERDARSDAVRDVHDLIAAEREHRTPQSVSWLIRFGRGWVAKAVAVSSWPSPAQSPRAAKRPAAIQMVEGVRSLEASRTQDRAHGYRIWNTYLAGAYEQHLGEARAAARRTGILP